MKNADYVSTINIDLGARYTGVYVNTYEYGEFPSSGIGVTLCLPEEGGRMTWSQSGRTSTRHRIRSNKRRKQAKRLMKLLIKELLINNKIQLRNETWLNLWEATKGVLNRRGYNRIEAEVDLSYLENVDASLLSEVIPEFSSAHNVLEQWESFSQNLDLVRQLVESKLLQLNKIELKKELKAFEKDDKDQLLQAISLIKTAASSIINQVDYGHQHRREYLNDIKNEIEKDSRFQPITAVIGVQAFWSLVGNISNLQLRSTRWFFNNKSHITGDTLDLNKLKEVLIRWLSYWRPENSEEKARQNEIIAKLKIDDDVLQILSQLDPNWTIPPYEDQDNRRPPKDQTLLLSPLALNKAYGDKWERWALIFKKSNSEWFEGLDEITSHFDRKSRLPKTINGNRVESPITQEQLKLAYFLQRILDRNSRLDPYALRYISKHRDTQKAQSYYKQLELDLGSQHVEEFLELCALYYNEVELAKQGLWIVKDGSLLERSNLNPPHKKKLLHLLVGGILGENLSQGSLLAFTQEAWTSRVSGNTTLRGICKKIEEVRKEHGNLFNEKLRRLRYRLEETGAKEKDVLKSADDNQIWRVYTLSIQAADSISKHFNHTPEKARRYSNTFSLAQIYNLLESDPRGFSSNGIAINLEQNWRMSEIEHEGKVYARCSRMPADSVRPFDGVLKRVLEQQAHTIANKKVDELKIHNLSPGSSVDIHINIEENRFAFTEELLDLKKASAAKRKKFTEKLDRQSQRWQSKTDRIKTASKDICPYTGQNIGRHGEIDHIIPRAESRAKSGTVFNSEANLIWCSQDGNQRKGATPYFLPDLSSKYLQTLFGKTSINEVKNEIETVVMALPKDFIFESLTESEQNAVRHALFLPYESPARQKVMLRLGVQSSARVNGTQAWLARRIIEQLQSKLHGWAKSQNLDIRYHASKINAEDVSRIRSHLAEHYPETGKAEQQGVASHTVDAVCVYARAAIEPKLMDRLAVGELFAEDTSALRQIVPETIAVEPIERRLRYHKTDIASQPIFKEGIYGEHFLPIWNYDGELRIGFDPYNNPIVVSGKNTEVLLQALSGVLLVEAGTKITEQLIKYEVNKTAAFEVLDRVWRSPVSDSEKLAADILDGLRYSTGRKNVETALLNQQGNAFNKREDIVKEKDFTINVNINGDKAFKAKGTQVHPAKYDWSKLLSSPEIAPLLGTKPETQPNLRQVLENHFNSGSNRSHSKTRRVYSLPIVDAPSGGFRIKRRSENGTHVYQLHAIEGTSAKGFTVTKGKINWNELATIDQLKNSSNVTPVGGRHAAEVEAVVLFDKWLTVSLPSDLEGKILELQISPATKSRMYLRVKQPLSGFKNWLQGSTDSEIESIFDIRNQIKVDSKMFFDNHKVKLLAAPRGTLFIEELNSEYVCYRYEVGSNNAEMKQAYQNAYDSLKE